MKTPQLERCGKTCGAPEHHIALARIVMAALISAACTDEQVIDAIAIHITCTAHVPGEVPAVDASENEAFAAVATRSRKQMTQLERRRKGGHAPEHHVALPGAAVSGGI